MHQPRRVSWNASCDLSHRSHPDLLNGNPERWLELFVEHAGIGQQRKRQFRLHLLVSAITSEFRGSNPFNRCRRKRRQSENLEYRRRRIPHEGESPFELIWRKRWRQSFANSERHAAHRSPAPAAASAAAAATTGSNIARRCIAARRTLISGSITKLDAFSSYPNRSSNQRIICNAFFGVIGVCRSSIQQPPAFGCRAKSAAPAATFREQCTDRCHAS